MQAGGGGGGGGGCGAGGCGVVGCGVVGCGVVGCGAGRAVCGLAPSPPPPTQDDTCTAATMSRATSPSRGAAAPTPGRRSFTFRMCLCCTSSSWARIHPARKLYFRRTDEIGFTAPNLSPNMIARRTANVTLYKTMQQTRRYDCKGEAGALPAGVVSPFGSEDRRDSGRRLCYDCVFGHGATLCFYRPHRPAGGRPRQAAQKCQGHA